MRLSSEIIGKQILSLSDGRRLGVVYDLYLDRDIHTILALHLGYDDLFGDNVGLIERSNVVAFGRDAILTADGEIVVINRHAPPALPGSGHWLLNEQLLGREAQTVNGRPLGTLVDLILSEFALEVSGFVIATHNLGDGAVSVAPRAEIILRDLGARQPVAIHVHRPFPLTLLEANQSHFPPLSAAPGCP